MYRHYNGVERRLRFPRDSVLFDGNSLPKLGGGMLSSHEKGAGEFTSQFILLFIQFNRPRELAVGRFMRRSGG